MSNLAQSFDLTGVTALVTGASAGLGLGFSEALAAAGARIIMLSRNKSKLENAASSIRSRGQEANIFVCDVTDRDAFASGLDHFPPIDVLVNNAGMNIPDPFVHVTERDFDQIFELNVRAAFFVAVEVTKRMIEHGIKGSIINVSSQMGHVGAANRTVYCASKHALEGLTKAMAVELASHGIRVNSVAPTFIETPMTKPYFEDEDFRDSVLNQIPLGEIGQIQDVAGAVVFLASSAARMITGTSLKVDGGWTAR